MTINLYVICTQSTMVHLYMVHLFEVRDVVVAKIKSTTNFLHFVSDLDT